MLLDPIAVLPALVTAAAQAAREVMAVYLSDHNTQHKPDGSPVTEADVRADRVIRRALEAALPGIAIWSEESSAPPICPATNQLFLVDPLDGTKEFIARNGEFTVNIALIHGGVPVAGVVHAPALGEVFCGAAGYGSWGWTANEAAVSHSSNEFPPLGAHALRVRELGAGSLIRVLGSRSHRGDATPLNAWISQQRRRGRECVVQPCGSSLKFCRIAQGAADAYPRFGPTSQWDTAAGHCVLAAAGGHVRDLSGSDLRYGLDRSVINPDFIASGIVDL